MDLPIRDDSEVQRLQCHRQKYCNCFHDVHLSVCIPLIHFSLERRFEDGCRELKPSHEPVLHLFAAEQAQLAGRVQAGPRTLHVVPDRLDVPPFEGAFFSVSTSNGGRRSRSQLSARSFLQPGAKLV